VSQSSGIEVEGALAAAGSDFEFLDKLRRVTLAERLPGPEQLDLVEARGGGGVR
jgi:hypothetical protein